MIKDNIVHLSDLTEIQKSCENLQSFLLNSVSKSCLLNGSDSFLKGEGTEWETSVHTFVKSEFDQIRDQIHEIRNFLWPLDLKLEGLDVQITKSRISFEKRTSELEARIAENSSAIAQQAERLKQIERFLNMSQAGEKTIQTPVHEDKANPVILPPQTPPLA